MLIVTWLSRLLQLGVAVGRFPRRAAVRPAASRSMSRSSLEKLRLAGIFPRYRYTVELLFPLRDEAVAVVPISSSTILAQFTPSAVFVCFQRQCNCTSGPRCGFICCRTTADVDNLRLPAHGTSPMDRRVSAHVHRDRDAALLVAG